MAIYSKDIGVNEGRKTVQVIAEVVGRPDGMHVITYYAGGRKIGRTTAPGDDVREKYVWENLPILPKSVLN